MRRFAIGFLLLVLLVSFGCAARPLRADRNRPGPGPAAAESAGQQDVRGSVVVGGTERTYKAHLPPAYRRDQPVPLVLVLHGGGGTGETIERVTGMSQKADAAGFIVVYPDGSGPRGGRLLTWNAGGCCDYAQAHNVDDVGFISALLTEVSRSYGVDRNRVFVAGFSNGGMMAYRLACELSDRIAAIAVVSSSMTETSCNPTRPVSVLHIHGTKDEHAPFQGGVGAKSETKVNHESVPNSVKGWAQRIGATQRPQVTYRSGSVTCETYKGGGAEATLCTVDGGEHSWPGGARDKASAFSATTSISAFFSSHARQ
jgi:polyhydroxybutyrate depolymerase